jgi:hypothetical protein
MTLEAQMNGRRGLFLAALERLGLRARSSAHHRIPPTSGDVFPVLIRSMIVHGYGASYMSIFKTRLVLVDHHASKRVMDSRGLGIIQCPLNHDTTASYRQISCANQAQFSLAILVNTHAVAHEIAVAPPTTGIADTAS